MQNTLNTTSDNTLSLTPPIKLGYWALRGKAQLIRLVLYYFKIPFQDQLFTKPCHWYKKQQQFPHLDFGDLPYIKDGQIILTDTIPIVTYVLKKNGHEQFLGKNYRDQSYVDTFLWSVEILFSKMIGLICCNNIKSQHQIKSEKQKLWKIELEEKLDSFQSCPTYNNGWYLGYLSIVDFSIYEIVHYLKIMYPNRTQKFKNLLAIQKKVGQLEEITKYENSASSIKQFLPTKMQLTSQYKGSCMKRC